MDQYTASHGGGKIKGLLTGCIGVSCTVGASNGGLGCRCALSAGVLVVRSLRVAGVVKVALMTTVAATTAASATTTTAVVLLLLKSLLASVV